MYTLRELELLFDLKNCKAIRQEIRKLEREIRESPRDDLMRRRAALCRRAAEVERRLDACPKGRRDLLRARFYDGKSWYRIANEMGYSPEYLSGKYLRATYRRYLSV